MSAPNWIEIAFLFLALSFILKIFSASFQQAVAPAIRFILQQGLSHRWITILSGLWFGFVTQSAHQVQVFALTAFNSGSFQLMQTSHLILGAHVGASLFSIVFLLPLYPWTLPLGACGLLLVVVSSRGYTREVGGTISAGALFYFLAHYFYQHIQLPPVPEYFVEGLIFLVALFTRSSLMALLIAFLWNGGWTYNVALASVIAANFGTMFGMIPALVKGRPLLFEIFVIQFIQKCAGSLALVFVLSQQWAPVTSLFAFSFSEWVVVLHILFNVIGVVLAALVYPLLQNLFLSRGPQPKRSQKLIYLGYATEIPPEGAVFLVSQEVQRLMALVLRQFEILVAVDDQIQTTSAPLISIPEQIDKYEVISDRVKIEVRVFMTKLLQSRLLPHQTRELLNNLSIVEELERISDQVRKIAWLTKKSKTGMPQDTSQSLRSLFQGFESIFSYFTLGESEKCHLVLKDLGTVFTELDEPATELSSSRIDFEIKKLFAHVKNICERSTESSSQTN